jgi:hypothetical protein
MKPYDMMSSFRGVNTLLQGQQNKGRTKKEITEERTQKADQQTDKSSRSKEGPTQMREDEITGDPRIRSTEEPGPLRDATSEGQSTL